MAGRHSDYSLKAHLTFQKECVKGASMPRSFQGGTILKLKQIEEIIPDAAAAAAAVASNC